MRIVDLAVLNAQQLTAATYVKKTLSLTVQVYASAQMDISWTNCSTLAKHVTHPVQRAQARRSVIPVPQGQSYLMRSALSAEIPRLWSKTSA